jgi:hypothetical protein
MRWYLTIWSNLDEALVGLDEEGVLLVPALVEQLLLLHQLLVPGETSLM